jgi:putative heme-binding domain-containing protein
MRYRSGSFGDEYRDNFFVANYSGHSVQRHVLTRDGATFRATTTEFLCGRQRDFFPTDVLEDADGSLLVVDTGRWYGYCGSHGSRLKVKGGIYRIRRKNHPIVTDPRGLAIDWAHQSPGDLVPLLADPRFVVRDRTTTALTHFGPAAVPALTEALQENPEPQLRRNALWTLSRIDGDAARAAVRKALVDSDAGVRLTAIYVASLHRDVMALERLTHILATDSPAHQREAASGLGRLRSDEGVPALFRAIRSEATDRFLEHALTYALIDAGAPAATREGLQDDSPRVRKAALIALDQMPGAKLGEEEVAALLDTEHAGVRDAALRVLRSHPQWGGSAERLLKLSLLHPDHSPTQTHAIRGIIISFSNDARVAAAVHDALASSKTPLKLRLLFLESFGACRRECMPASWMEHLRQALQSSDDRVVLEATKSILALGEEQFENDLRALATDDRRADELRLAALAATIGRHPQLHAELYAMLRRCLDPKQPSRGRLIAAGVIRRAELTASQLDDMVDVVKNAGPLELPGLLPALKRCRSPDSGRRLIQALRESPYTDTLHPEAVADIVTSLSSPANEAAHPLLERLRTNRRAKDGYLHSLEQALPQGDPCKGRSVFFGDKAACASCHRVEHVGGQLGPDLSRIGTARTRRELLEAIVFPSAGFARGYEPYLVTTRNGRQYYGVLSRQTHEEIGVTTLERREVRLTRSAVESIEPGRESLMPRGLERLLTRSELADLLAFLRSLK